MADQQALLAAERIAPYAPSASVQAALAGCAYLVYALWVTWPMPAHVTSSVYGPGGDVTGAMAMWRELAQNAFSGRGTRVAGRNRGTGPLVCHGRQVLNGYREGTSAEARALTLARLNDPQTPARLRTLGVRYVVLNAARTFGPEVPAPGQPDPAFRLLATDGSHQLYEVGPRALKRSSGGSSGYERWRVGDPDAD